VRANGGPPTVLAVVMTYNRREVLRRCLEAIRAQTLRPAGVQLLDNGSTDGTIEMVASDFPEVRVHGTGENLGSAGAIREALRVALETAPDYVWFFDDDVVAHPSCLEILLREIRSLEPDVRVGVLRPMVRDPHTGEVGGGATPHGALLSGAMARVVGLPPGDTFMELSDPIYNAMIRKHGYQILRVPFVLAEHQVRNEKSLRQVVREGFSVTPWRLYYAVRNRIWHSVYKEHSPRQFARTVAIALRTLFLLTLFGRPRRGHLMVIRGLIDGMLGRLGRRVEPTY